MQKINNHPEYQWLQQSFTQGRISRRNFIGRSLALGVSATLINSAVSTRALAAGPKVGGTLTAALAGGATTDTIDPSGLENMFQVAVSEAVSNTLTAVSPQNTVEPALATSWESTPDAKVWTFKLREGVTFHNGKTMTAEDVIASINYHRGEDSKSAVKEVAKAIEDIKPDGSNTVVFTLASGSADFPFLMNSHNFAIYPAKDDTIAWQEGGTGAYLLNSYDPGVSAKLVRNPNYWRSDRGFFEEVNLLTIYDASARSAALLTGQIDVMERVDLKTANMLARDSKITIEEVAGSLHYNFPMMMGAKPFDDPNVRLALKHAINRQEMMDKIIFGRGSIGNDTPIGPSYRYFDKDLAPLPYDPDKARYYLKQSGLEGLSIDLSAADAAFGGAVDAATLFREHAARAGININVVREADDGYWSNVWMKKPFCACYWAGYPTEDQMFSMGYGPTAAWNDTQWNNETFNKLLSTARAELDENKRREMYFEMQRLLRDEGGQIVPMFANHVFARRDTIAHGDMTSDSGMDGGRFIERWWSAA